MNRYDIPPSIGLTRYKNGRLVYFDDYEKEVRELEKDVSMWRGRAMELLSAYANATGSAYQSVLDKWEWQEKNRKNIGDKT